MWEAFLRLNFTAVYTFKNKNNEHRRIEFKFLVTLIPSFMSSFATFVSYRTIIFWSIGTLEKLNFWRNHRNLKICSVDCFKTFNVLFILFIYFILQLLFLHGLPMYIICWALEYYIYLVFFYCSVVICFTKYPIIIE